MVRLLWFVIHLNEHQKRKKKIERFLSFPKLASHQQQGDEEGSFASCSTRGKKGVKRDLPESQSSHSELEPTGSLLGSDPGTGGAPLQRRSPVVWLTSSGPAGGAKSRGLPGGGPISSLCTSASTQRSPSRSRKGFLFFFVFS